MICPDGPIDVSICVVVALYNSGLYRSSYGKEEEIGYFLLRVTGDPLKLSLGLNNKVLLFFPTSWGRSFDTNNKKGLIKHHFRMVK